MTVTEAIREFAACGSDGAACAGFICGLYRESPAFLRQLAGLAKNADALLSVDVVKAWPEDEFGVLVEFISAMPYKPDVRNMPCGRRELFIAEVLSDMSVPKPRRIAVWRAFAMNGLKFPKYTRGSWNVPRQLVDHMAVRGWIAATRGEGWSDLRNSDPTFFADDKAPSFDNDFEKAAWEAIAQDSPAGLMMPLAMMGKSLPSRFLSEVLRVKAMKILVYLLSKGKCQMKSRDLLLYVCANWNNDQAIPVVALLEKSEPGLVASTVDSYGHNALWYTLYQRDRFGKATPAARREMDPLDVSLIELGCNPAQECFLGLSWQDVAEKREAVLEEGVPTDGDKS